LPVTPALQCVECENKKIAGYFGDTDHLNGQISVILTTP